METDFSCYKARAGVFKALAHPTRLFFIEQLAMGEQCVCELTAMVGIKTSTVSRHLSVLKNAGIVTDEKRGLNVFYRLKMPCVLSFLSCVDNAVKG